MVNWQEAGKTWPLPHPHAVYLLRGLVWGQHYRHKNPQCEGGMPGSFELREDMGADRLQAVEDWLRAEGYAYRFRQKRWRVWTRPDRPGEGLRPDRIEEDENPNEYPSGATINVSIWDMIEKKFPEPGNEGTLQSSSSSASPGKEKRSAGDKKRDKKWREYQGSLAAEAAQAAENETKGGTPAPSPQRASKSSNGLAQPSTNRPNGNRMNHPAQMPSGLGTSSASPAPRAMSDPPENKRPQAALAHDAPDVFVSASDPLAKRRRLAIISPKAATFKIPNNNADPPAANPPLLQAYPLREEQRRSLGWMLSQETKLPECADDDSDDDDVAVTTPATPPLATSLRSPRRPRPSPVSCT